MSDDVRTSGNESSAGGPVMVWDHEDCPLDGCDGELQQQDKFNVMCLECEAVWTHVKSETKHCLQTEDFVTVAEKPVAMTDGGSESVEFNDDGELWAVDVRELESKLADFYGVDTIALQAVVEDGDDVHHEAMTLGIGEDSDLLADYVPVFEHAPSGATGVSKDDLPSKAEVQEVA